MPEAHRRQKQPELIRSQLLLVVRDILVQEGPHAVTLDAVSRRANVTKGGLQHHFRSKQALLQALCDQLFGEFQANLALALEQEPDGPGRRARAYIRACFDTHSQLNQVETQRAIGLLALTLPEARERWHQAMQAELAADGEGTGHADLLLVCRMAADGFWFAQMLDAYPLDAARSARLLNLMLQLCSQKAP
jgi:AcrR family transcriptional regulator